MSGHHHPPPGGAYEKLIMDHGPLLSLDDLLSCSIGFVPHLSAVESPVEKTGQSHCHGSYDLRVPVKEHPDLLSANLESAPDTAYAHGASAVAIANVTTI